MPLPASWRNLRVFLLVLFVLLLGFSIIAYYRLSGPPTTVILVRHAEKADEPETPNPTLSSAGLERAQILVHVLSQAEISSIYATQYLRTQQTVKPLADRLGLGINQVEARNTEELVKRIKVESRGHTILVAGHSNSVPEIIAALGGEQLPQIPDDQYDDLFVVTIAPWQRVRVLALKYGNFK